MHSRLCSRRSRSPPIQSATCRKRFSGSMCKLLTSSTAIPAGSSTVRGSFAPRRSRDHAADWRTWFCQATTLALACGRSFGAQLRKPRRTWETNVLRTAGRLCRGLGVWRLRVHGANSPGGRQECAVARYLEFTLIVASSHISLPVALRCLASMPVEVVPAKLCSQHVKHQRWHLGGSASTDQRPCGLASGENDEVRRFVERFRALCGSNPTLRVLLLAGIAIQLFEIMQDGVGSARKLNSLARPDPATQR